MTQTAEVTIYFGSHSSRSDGRNIPLIGCDVYAPEFAGWDPTLKMVYEKVSNGRLAVARAVRLMEEREGVTFHDFNLGQFSILSGTHKKVIMIDWPHSHPDWPRLLELKEVINTLAPLTEPFESAVATTTRDIQEFSVLQAEREHYIADRIRDAVPGLGGKRLLVSIGGCHTNLIRLLQARGIRARRIQQRALHVFSPKDRAARYTTMGLPIPGDLGAYCLLWGILSTWYFTGKTTTSSRLKLQAALLLGKITRHISEVQIAELWDRCRQSTVPKGELLRCLRSFGIELPESFI